MGITRTGSLDRHFRKEAVADVVSALPKPTTPMTDLFFPANRRKQKHSSLISIEDITATTGAVPMVRRGSSSYAVDPATKTSKFIDLDGIIISRFFSAKDVNDLLATGDAESIQAWVNENIEYLRDRVSETTETLVRQAFSGKIAYPYASEAGISGAMEIDLGSPNALTAATITKSKKLGGLQLWLESLLSGHRAKAGSGGSPRVFAGSDVYSAIVEIVSAIQNPPAEWTDYGVKLFGKYEIQSLDETFTLPGANSATAMLAANKVRVVDMANTGNLIYAALDDLDANLAPMPFYCKPIRKQDPDGTKLVASSKPLPAFAMKRMSEQTITVV